MIFSCSDPDEKDGEGVLSVLVRTPEGDSSSDSHRSSQLRWPLLHPDGYGENILTDLTPVEERNDVLQVQQKGR